MARSNNITMTAIGLAALAGVGVVEHGRDNDRNDSNADDQSAVVQLQRGNGIDFMAMPELSIADADATEPATQSLAPGAATRVVFKNKMTDQADRALREFVQRMNQSDEIDDGVKQLFGSATTERPTNKNIADMIWRLAVAAQPQTGDRTQKKTGGIYEPR